MAGLKMIDDQECNFMVSAVKRYEIRTITEIEELSLKILFVQLTDTVDGIMSLVSVNFRTNFEKKTMKMRMVFGGV